MMIIFQLFDSPIKKRGGKLLNEDNKKMISNSYKRESDGFLTFIPIKTEHDFY